MEIQLNHNEPHIMHIDLNSCFAMVEQQANPLLRNKPVAIVPFLSPSAVIISPSYELKAYGVKTGWSLRDARLVCKDIIVRKSDVAKYRDVHSRFKRIFQTYSPNVYPKSIDEAVIDFSGTAAMYGYRTLTDIGKEIKEQMKEEIGEWITCNIGISTNIFLAKLAASLHKPDGMDVITHENILDVYNKVKLIDLNGIGERYQARLNANAIFTPLQFLRASKETLHKYVFRSVVGSYWYDKLRGYESDPFEYDRGSFGRQYALQRPTADPEKLAAKLLKLCDRAGRKMRRAGYAAEGVHVACEYDDHTYWHKGKTFRTEMVYLQELYERAIYVFNMQPYQKVVRKLSVSFFDIAQSAKAQASLFDFEPSKQQKIGKTMDEIKDRYGEDSIMLARMMGMEDEIEDRISFGGVKDLEDLYEEADVEENYYQYATV